MSKIVLELSNECLVQLKHAALDRGLALDRNVKPIEIAVEILEKFAKKKMGKSVEEVN
jgi:hypothetical protein